MGRARDLDNSLDEIIKNKNKRGIKKGTPHITRQNQTRQYSNATPQQRNSVIRRMDNRAIQKRTSHPINNRLGTKVPPPKPMTTQIKGVSKIFVEYAKVTHDVKAETSWSHHHKNY